MCYTARNRKARNSQNTGHPWRNKICFGYTQGFCRDIKNHQDYVKCAIVDNSLVVKSDVRPKPQNITWFAAAAIAFFLTIGSVAFNLSLNYPYDEMIKTDYREIVWNMSLFSIAQFVAYVGVLKGLPKIFNHTQSF